MTDLRPTCTAHSSQTGAPCRKAPVKGATVCATHGGRAPQVKAGAEKRLREEQAKRAVAHFGLPVDIPADEALAEELARTNGMVAYLQALVTSLSRDELKQRDVTGKFEKPAVWVEMLGQERDRLRVTAKTMIDVGFAERQVRMAEGQGQLLAAGLGWFLGQLGLASDERARGLVADMLRHLAAGEVPALEQGGAA